MDPRRLPNESAFAIVLHRPRMNRNHLADCDSLGIVVPGLELNLKQLTMFIQRLRDCISKIVRRIVANIDEMIGPHYRGNRSVHASKKEIGRASCRERV